MSVPGSSTATVHDFRKERLRHVFVMVDGIELVSPIAAREIYVSSTTPGPEASLLIDSVLVLSSSAASAAPIRVNSSIKL